jgi:hypothetical protein
MHVRKRINASSRLCFKKLSESFWRPFEKFSCCLVIRIQSYTGSPFPFDRTLASSTFNDSRISPLRVFCHQNREANAHEPEKRRTQRGQESQNNNGRHEGT